MSKQKKNRVKRSIRVEELRDAALAILKVQGEIVVSETGPEPGICTDIEGFSIRHGTPFQEKPPVPEKVRQFVDSKGEELHEYQYSLDIWHDSKVLNIEWNPDQAPKMRSFKRGDWEEKFLDLAEKTK
jgi:hypothetical protein